MTLIRFEEGPEPTCPKCHGSDISSTGECADCTADSCGGCGAPPDADCICDCPHKGGAHKVRATGRWYCDRCGDEMEGPDPDSAWDARCDRD